MTIEEQGFLDIFRVLIPDISAEDNAILDMCRLSKPMVSRKRFGALYEQALCYLVAHRLVIKDVITAESADGISGAAGAISSKLIAGNILSEKEGDLSRTYGSSSSSSSAGSDGTDPLDKTFYGMEFKRLRKMCVVTGMTRFG